MAEITAGDACGDRRRGFAMPEPSSLFVGAPLPDGTPTQPMKKGRRNASGGLIESMRLASGGDEFDLAVAAQMAAERIAHRLDVRDMRVATRERRDTAIGRRHVGHDR